MAEENKNLEIQEGKSHKSWLFRVGLFLIVLAILGIGLIFALFKGCVETECLIGTMILMFIPIPLLVIGIILILVHYFFKLWKKEKFLLLDWIILIFIILFILWFFGSRLLRSFFI